jgi:hypothetical protein
MVYKIWRKLSLILYLEHAMLYIVLKKHRQFYTKQEIARFVHYALWVELQAFLTMQGLLTKLQLKMNDCLWSHLQANSKHILVEARTVRSGLRQTKQQSSEQRTWLTSYEKKIIVYYG